jgi:tRNA-dihydrouridine synthase
MEAPRQPPTVYLAPLKGFTDAVFRNTFTAHFGGFDGAVAPFITAVPADRLKDGHLNDVLPQNNGSLRLIPQILGNSAADFVFLARRLHRLGYDEVNWNLGCPFRPVAKKKRGAGLLPFPEQVDEFLDQTLRALPGRLSIKMRLGRSSPDEIFRLLPILERYPLSAVIIHPRTGRQMYGGQPDLDTFAACLAMTRHRVVYNGDINDPAGFARLRARFPQIGCWMIGRGALSDPFLPSLIASGANDVADRIGKFKAFYEELFARYQERLSGPGHLLGRMKGFWKYFAPGFVNGRDVEKRIHRSFRLPHYLETVERFFEHAEWENRPPPQAPPGGKSPVKAG